jgi:diacylglycerol kinase family enzyme
VLMRRAPKLVFLRVLLMIRNGTHGKLHQISTGRATDLIVGCDRSMPVGADGESLTIPFPLRVGIMPNALRVIVPC